MYLATRPSHPRTLSASFPHRVMKEQPGGYMNFLLTATERADDIADTAGRRAFPWRAFVVARRDADLVASDMVTRLAPPPAADSDFSWVRPGKVVWDYWADWNLEDVDFVAGRNTRTFKFHVDFAAAHHLPYVNIDWLWSDPLDLTSLNPEIDVPEIVRYAREKNVGVFVWCLARTLERQLEPAMNRFNPQGTPPGHDVTIPFTRMLAGPMDYTPGAMRALSKANWKAMNDLPASQGTIAHQLAMYVVYDAPLVLSDMPTAYAREPEALRLLEDVPTTWDETLGVAGRIGESVVVARRKGDEWWIGALTNWDARTVEVPLEFTGGGRWEATAWMDGVNAGRVGSDYRRATMGIDAAEPLRLTMAPGGGAVVRLRRGGPGR